VGTLKSIGDRPGLITLADKLASEPVSPLVSNRNRLNRKVEMMLNVEAARPFLMVAREITRKLTSTDEPFWWESIISLSWTLERWRLQLGSPVAATGHHDGAFFQLALSLLGDCPALLIVERTRNTEPPDIAKPHPEFARLTDESYTTEVTSVLYSDPWRNIIRGREHLAMRNAREKWTVFADQKTKTTIIDCLQSWINATECAIDAEHSSQADTVNESRFSKRTFTNTDIRRALTKKQGRTESDLVSTSSAERFIQAAKDAKQIDRKKKEPMRLRLDLMDELNLKDLDPS
jgi:hypothetical protein